MIQTKDPVIYDQRSQRTAIVKINVIPLSPNTEGQMFRVNDCYLTDVEDSVFGMVTIEKSISSKEIFWSNEQINQMEDYLESSHDFSGFTRVEKERKKLQIALFIDTTQTNLLPNGNTIYGLDPSDWEFTAPPPFTI